MNLSCCYWGRGLRFPLAIPSYESEARLRSVIDALGTRQFNQRIQLLARTCEIKAAPRQRQIA